MQKGKKSWVLGFDSAGRGVLLGHEQRKKKGEGMGADARAPGVGESEGGVQLSVKEERGKQGAPAATGPFPG